MEKRKRRLNLFIIFLIIFLSLTSVSALTCNVVNRGTCTSGCNVGTISDCSGQIVMDLSSNTNAHAETSGTYSEVLCCDGGTRSFTCTGTNKITGLSSLTNAHAELPDINDYTNEICYEGVSCINTQSSCDDPTIFPYDIPMISLSSPTNAHIGGPSAYVTGTGSRICCENQFIDCTLTNAYWSTDGTNPITAGTKIQSGDSIYLVVIGSGAECDGLDISLEIWEKGGNVGIFNPDDQCGVTAGFTACPFPTSIIDPFTSSVAKFSGDTAIAEWSSYGPNPLDSGETVSTYYFKGKVGQNPPISSETNNPLLEVEGCDINCQSITTCSEYTTSTDCSTASAAVKSNINACCTDGTCNNCRCGWDAADTPPCSGLYDPIPVPVCGNSQCETGECPNGANPCPADCTADDCAYCGNEVLDTGETCDYDAGTWRLMQFISAIMSAAPSSGCNIASLGFYLDNIGTLYCGVGCDSYDYLIGGCRSEVAASCGDGAVNQLSEDCDGTQFRETHCTALPGSNYASGDLSCYPVGHTDSGGISDECKYDLSGCVPITPPELKSCGDSILQDESAGGNSGGVMEQCEFTSPEKTEVQDAYKNQPCSSYGEPGTYVSGILVCDPANCRWDVTRNCQSPPPHTCGDGNIDTPNDANVNENCDPDAGTPAFISALQSLAPDARCNAFNSIFLPNSGNLGCDSFCDYDIVYFPDSQQDNFGCNLPSGAVLSCGDGIVSYSETCDAGEDKIFGTSDDDFGVLSCAWFGGTGSLTCTPANSIYPCQVSISSCNFDIPPEDAICGDGNCNGLETCETCESDCGTCQTSCGDGTCEIREGESCSTCESDCGVCNDVCGDGTCNGDEDCETCESDCGKCSDNEGRCGDHVCDASEDCVSCSTDCGTCITTCPNSVCEDGESCSTCESDCGTCNNVCGDGTCDILQGETPGTCAEDCTNTCGNGVIETNKGEVCDNNILNDDTWATPVFPVGQTTCPTDDVYAGTGTLRCNGACKIDYNECDFKPGVVPVCGDGYYNLNGEECDGEDLQGMKCELFGYDTGVLNCYDSTYVDEDGNYRGCSFDKSGCETVGWMGECGDWIFNNDKEQCDTNDFKGKSCRTLGYKRGQLACTDDCQVNKKGCSGILGETEVEKKIPGTCKTGTTDVSGNCKDDNEITYTWTGEWIPAEGADTTSQNYITAMEACTTGGTRTIPCPSQLQLGFFDLYNIIATAAVIGIIYTIIIFRKKHKFIK